MNVERYVLIGLLVPSLAVLAYLVLDRQEHGRESTEPISKKVEEGIHGLHRVAAATAPVSDREEKQAGKTLNQQISSNYHVLSPSDPRSKYVSSVGNIVALHGRRSFDYRFRVLNVRMINAFALPGGYIYITTGMLHLIKNEAELAFVLQHELAHVDLYHCADLVRYRKPGQRGGPIENIAATVQDLVRRSYSIRQEKDADHYSILLSFKTSYTPLAGADLFQRLLKLQSRTKPTGKKEKGRHEHIGDLMGEALDRYLASHPDLNKRVRVIRQLSREYMSEKNKYKFYRGTSNYSDKTSKGEDVRDKEWIRIQ